MIRRFCLLVTLATLPLLAIAQIDRAALVAEYWRLDSLFESNVSTDLGLAVEQSKKLLEIATQLQVDTLLLNARQQRGQALNLFGIFDGALSLYYANLAMAENTQNCYFKVKSTILISRVFQSMNDPAKSQEFLKKAKQYALECRSFEDTVAINFELGFNMVVMGEEQAGLQLLEDNLLVARKTNNAEDILYGLDNLANVMLASENYTKALEYELELGKMMDTWDDAAEKTAIYEHLSEIYCGMQEWDNAQKYQQLAMDLSTELGLNDWIYECYKLQSQIDAGRGQYKSALTNHQRYLALKDSVYQNQYDEKMSAMSALYELDVKEKTIALLEKDKQIKAVQIEEQRILMFVGLLLLLLLLLGNRILHQRKTAKLRETFAQDLLKAQENERQMIARELHDSVGQNILFIKNRLQRLVPAADDALVKCADDALEEVRGIAKGLYPNQLEQYGLSSAVEALCTMASESSGVFASCDLQGIDEKLSREARINCYRIIQECINNTLKHASASAIRITSQVLPGKVSLVVQDNGKGFDKTELERKSARSFGLLGISERINMLRGKFDLESSANKGTKLTFQFPV